MGRTSVVSHGFYFSMRIHLNLEITCYTHRGKTEEKKDHMQLRRDVVRRVLYEQLKTVRLKSV